jgi:hypothetical protein
MTDDELAAVLCSIHRSGARQAAQAIAAGDAIAAASISQAQAAVRVRAFLRAVMCLSVTNRTARSIDFRYPT